MGASEYPGQVVIVVEREYEKEALDREVRRLAEVDAEFDAALIRPAPPDSESPAG
jgi:hypothetical protein